MRCREPGEQRMRWKGWPPLVPAVGAVFYGIFAFLRLKVSPWRSQNQKKHAFSSFLFDTLLEI